MSLAGSHTSTLDEETSGMYQYGDTAELISETTVTGYDM